MARKQFVVVYPDGSKKNIGCTERDSLLLSREIKQINNLRYAYTGEVRTFHSFADLAPLREIVEPSLLRRFLGGSFVFEHKGRKHHELLETPEAFADRLERTGQLACA